MKHIKIFEQYNQYAQVKAWLDSMAITNYTINDDLTVDVNGNVNLYDKYLTNIPIQFGHVSLYFNCGKNMLTSLKGCPNYVGEDFMCYNNKLTSLIGGPDYVGGHYQCSSNSLTSLEYLPKKVVKGVHCNHNEVTTLKGIPQGVIVDYRNNPLPPRILKLYNHDIQLLLKYQEEYSVWNNDGSLNQARFDKLLKDIDSGLLT